MDCVECERLGSDAHWHNNVRAHRDPDVGTAGGFRTAAAALYGEQLHLLLSKNADYSPLNISLAPFGVMEGLVTRISDKFYRIINLLEQGTEAKHESLEDSFRDLMGYAAIGVLCLQGEWPGVAKGGKKA
jgi:hypothetical protein